MLAFTVPRKGVGVGWDPTRLDMARAGGDRRRMVDREPSISRFEQLIAEIHKEQVYQQALEDAPWLIPRDFVQNHGIHLSLVLRKLPLGADLVTDFAFLSKSSDDWYLVLIEIEKPSCRYFADDGKSFHGDFNRALNQVGHWRAWVEANRTHLIEMIEPLLRPVVMQRNPVYVKYVLVHGRRSENASIEARRALVRAAERDDFRIMSYDSLLENARHAEDLYIAARHNNRFKVFTERFVGENLFVHVEPALLEIPVQLRNTIMSSKAEWLTRDGSGKLYLEYRLPEVRTYSK